MAKLSRKKGTTSQIFHVVIKDSTSTTGAGKTGLAYNTASLVCRWLNAWNPLSASITLEDITTLGTYAAPTSNAHMRFKEVSNVDPSKGLYEIQVHDSWMNLGGGNLIIMLAGATGMADCHLEVDLQADTNVTHISGTAQTARDIGASVLLSSGTGTGQVSLSSGLVTLAGVTHTGAVIPTVTAVTNDVGITQAGADKTWSTAARALTDKAGFALSAAGVQAIWDALTSALTTAGSVGKKLADWVLGSDSKVLLSSNAQTGVTIPTVTTLTGHTAQTGDSYALANGANGFVAIKGDTAAILVDTGTTLDTKLNNIQGATFDTATDSLEALRNRGDAAWTTATGFALASVCTETRLAELDAANLPADVSAGAIATATWNAATATYGSAGSYGLLVETNLNAPVSGATAPTAAAVADAVWDEAIAGHLGAGSTGAALNAAGAAGDPWTTNLPGAYGAGSAGYIIGTNINSTITSRASHAAADVWSVATRALTDKAGFSLAADQAVNTTKINGSATAATQLALSAATIVSGAAIAGTLSTTQMTTNLTEATDDHFNGRIIVWASGALLNQATDITDYFGADKRLVFTATTEAPSAADTFVII